MTGRYDHHTREDLIRLLERRDARQRYGLVWERDGIDRDRAVNDDFVVFDIDPAQSTPPQDARGWRNLVIEGDNWDALRALRLAYAGRIKCILIDPPYNTGNRDFAYNDRFVGAEDRFRHSTWLEFLYRRLILARDLLADDGVILVCINDENRARLDLLMEQVFPGMRVGSLVWRTRVGGNEGGSHFLSDNHEHILVYGMDGFRFGGTEKSFALYSNPNNDPRGDWKPGGDLTVPVAYNDKRAGQAYYPLLDPTRRVWYPCNPNRVWAYASRLKSTLKTRVKTRFMEDWIQEDHIAFPENPRIVQYDTLEELLQATRSRGVPSSGHAPMLREGLPDLDFWVGKAIAFGTPSFKRFKKDLKSTSQPMSSWVVTRNEKTEEDGRANILVSGTNDEGSKEIKSIFSAKAFTYAKPTSLFRALIKQATSPGDVVLDFFAGSGTTAHAVLALNAEDDGDRRFIMVSSTEVTVDTPDKNLCRDVCAERIRRVIAGYNDTPGLGGDFAYLRTRRIPDPDVLYDLDVPSVWTLLQLRFDRPLVAFDPALPVQLAPPLPDQPESPTLAYAPQASAAALAALAALAEPLVIFCPTPGVVREALHRPALAIDDPVARLIGEFPRNVVGL